MTITPEQAENLFPYFMALWVFAALTAAAFFYFNKDAGLKRKVFTVLVVAANFVVVIVCWIMGAPLFFIVFGGVIAAFGSWQAIRFTRFCHTCGANNFPKGQFQAPGECKQCGAPLSPAKA